MSTEYDKDAAPFAKVVKNDSLSSLIGESETVQEEGAPAVAETTVSGPEEARVPYSRFEKKHQEALEARQEADFWKSQAESSRQPVQQSSEELPDYWVELFGDTDASKKAFKAEQARIEAIEERAERRALESVQNRQHQEETRIESNLESIDSRVESLEDYLGRKITPKEEEELLDIVDDYTPKDQKGNYLGELISFDKAWNIREMQQQTAQAGTRRARNSVAAISGATSQGTPAAAEKDFQPQQWGSWRSRLK